MIILVPLMHGFWHIVSSTMETKINMKGMDGDKVMLGANIQMALKGALGKKYVPNVNGRFE